MAWFVDFFRWDAFVPLHRLWLGYMSELLGLGPVPSPVPPTLPQEERKGPPSSSLSASVSASAPTTPALPQPAGTMHAKLIKADFHGSIMTGEGSFGTAAILSCGEVPRQSRGGFCCQCMYADGWMDEWMCSGSGSTGVRRGTLI